MIISNKVLKDLYDEAMNDNVILFFGSFSKISPSGWIEEGEFKDGKLNSVQMKQVEDVYLDPFALPESFG